MAIIKPSKPSISLNEEIKDCIVSAINLMSNQTVHVDSDLMVLDGSGWNKYDAKIIEGMPDELSDKEIQVAYHLLRKYRRQLGVLWDKIYKEDFNYGKD